MILALDLVGVAVFAVTGALAAGRKQLDIFGVVVLGCVTALGGGTLRDVILGDVEVFWVADTRYLAVAALASIVTFLLARRWRLPQPLLLYADAVGLAVFTAFGFEKGYAVSGSYTIGMVMGVTTGVVGGMVRDVLSGEIPLVLRREVYASASLCGAALMALLVSLGVPGVVAVIASILATLSIRLAAMHRNLSLPRFSLIEEDHDPAHE
jgi:uncharacterized membrane protein YeiH